MSSWPAETKYIGHSTARIDAPAKLTGRAHYSSDIQADGWLYGMILRSQWPAAKILSVNLDKARQIPGIKAAVTVRDGPQYRALLWRGDCRCRRHEQTSLSRCACAPSRSRPSHSSHLWSMRTKRARKTRRQVWEGRANASAPHVRESGSVDTAFAECAAVIEGFYTTPVQLHHPMETAGNTVSWTEDGVDLLGFHAGNFQRARRPRRRAETGPKPGARHHRLHGRRLWRKIRRGR